MSHNCLVVAADNKTYGEIFTSTSTSTSTSAAALSTTESPEAEDTTLATDSDSGVVIGATSVKKFRQLNNKVGE